MNDEKTAFLGLVGTVASLSLAEINSLVGVMAGIATVVYVVTKTVLLIRPRK